MRQLLVILLTTFCFSVFAQDGLQRPDIPGELMIDIGLNYWDASSDSIDQKGWPSKSISIYYVKRKELTNKLSLMYGGGLGLEKFDMGNSHTLYSTADSTYLDVFPASLTEAGASINKNKLAVTYLDATFELRFHPKGTQDGEGLFIGVGGIAGLRLDAHTKWKYDANGETVRQKISGKFNLNSIRYGTQVRLGFRGVHFFYKQYFSEVFSSPIGVLDNEEPIEPRFNPTFRTFGINITGF